jgi:SnoaL-like domain
MNARDGLRRPLMDSIEVRAPRLAASAVRLLVHLPAPLRRRVLADAFARAEDAFNRGDFEAVFAVFADDVEYVPPPALYTGAPIKGRAAVLLFWQEILQRFEDSTIANLSVEETTPERFVRTARLTHRGHERSLDYVIRQTTELRAGRVARQVNEDIA